MPITLSADMEAVARQMVKDNTDDDQHTIQAAYLFPSDTEEIRLIYVDSTAYPSRDDDHVVKPFYFGADAASGVPFRSAVALIRPDEKDALSPPAGWGKWSDALLLYKA